MRIIVIVIALLLVVPIVLPAQQPPAPPRTPAQPSPPLPPTPRQPPLDLGKWWKNSQVVRDLQLSEDQIKSLEQIFLESRPGLSELRAELKRQETALQSLLDEDQPDQKKIEVQTDQVLAVRGKLEKANTGMMLSFRRALSVEQWRKLQGLRQARKNLQPPVAPPPPPLPPVPPAPPVPPKEVGKSASGDPIYAISGSIQPPVVVRNPIPAYTPEAKEKKVEGVVLLQVVVGKDGSVRDVKVLRSLGYGLDEAAKAILTREWRFEPGLLDGKPVDVRATIEISFRLN